MNNKKAKNMKGLLRIRKPQCKKIINLVWNIQEVARGKDPLS